MLLLFQPSRVGIGRQYDSMGGTVFGFGLELADDVRGGPMFNVMRCNDGC
jgi:hypothetical protein